MLRAAAVVLLLTAVALSGCADEPQLVPLDSLDGGVSGSSQASGGAGGLGGSDGSGPVVETEQPPAPDGTPVMTVSGVVQDEDAGPIAGALVTLLEGNRTRMTEADGTFVFENVPVGFQVLRADATDFLPAELTARPVEGGATSSVVFVLLRYAEEPYHQSVNFQGFMQCAAEYVIITPNCDEWTRSVGVPVFQAETIFPHQLEANWRTLVLDVDFDTSSQPAMDGLRVTVRGTTDADNLGSYEQYGRFYGADTHRIEPGGTYPDGDAPVPQDATTFEFQVYPHSLAYHPGGQSFLGVGAGVDVEFELFVTSFYVDPAPDGWSLLA